MITCFWSIYSFSIFGLGLLHSLKLVFFGSLLYFYPNLLLRFLFLFGTFIFLFSLSLLFMELIYTHFRLFIVANLIPSPPLFLFCTLPCIVIFILLLCEYIYFVQLNFFSLYNVFIFAWFIRYPMYREHCTSRKLRMYWGLE